MGGGFASNVLNAVVVVVACALLLLLLRRYAAGLTNLPTAERLPWLNTEPDIATVVEYRVDSTKYCNSSVVATERFHRNDLDNNFKISPAELDRMLYEMGRRHENGRQEVGVDVAEAVIAGLDSDGDDELTLQELLVADARRDELQAASVSEIVTAAGWIITGALRSVDETGAGLAAVPAPPAPEPDDGLLEVPKEAVGACIVDSGIENTYGQKACIITELLGIPEVESSEVRCVRKDSVDMFLNPIVDYQCVSWELCGAVPDPAYAAQASSIDDQPTYTYNCDFSGCTPDALRYGNDELTPPLNDFRCWDSCRLASGMDECAHIEQRSTHCRHGQPCFFVDTLDPSVSSDREAELKLLNVSMSINSYAGGCRALYGDVGYVEECRYMRCHAMGSATGRACDNVVPPPCRSVCEGYVEHTTDDLPIHPDLGDCDPDAAVPSPGSEDWWSYLHCQALLTGNCSAFPPDSEHATGGCTRPLRYEGGLACVREAECLSQSCPLAHSDDSPEVAGEGKVCCNFGLNGCSGHGVCTSHRDSHTPKSLGPDQPVEFGACVCDLEWTGADCSQWMMPWEMFLLITGTFAAMTFGSLTWCTFWFTWYWRVHAPPPPPKAQPPPKAPPKPRRDSDTEEDDASDDSEVDFDRVGCRLRLVICHCRELPMRKGILDTYVKATLNSDRSKRSTTCLDGGVSPAWRAPPSSPQIIYGTPPQTPGSPLTPAMDDDGEELSWVIGRGNYSLTLEAWNDESRFQHGSASLVDTLVCRARVKVTDPLEHPIPGYPSTAGQDIECWDKDGGEAGVIRIRLYWDDPGSPSGFFHGQSLRTPSRSGSGGGGGGNAQIMKVVHVDDLATTTEGDAAMAPQPPAGPAPGGARQRALPDGEEVLPRGAGGKNPRRFRNRAETGISSSGALERASVASERQKQAAARGSDDSSSSSSSEEGEAPDDLTGLEEEILNVSGASGGSGGGGGEAGAGGGKEDVLAQAEAAVLEQTV
jgi:hypothetical protein